MPLAHRPGQRAREQPSRRSMLPSLPALPPRLRALRRHALVDALLDGLLAAALTWWAIRTILVPTNQIAVDIGWDARRVVDDLAGAVFLWVLVALLLVVTRQRWLVSAVVVGTAVVTRVAHEEKLSVVGEPLLPSDLNFLGNLGFLASQTSGSTVVLPLVGGGLVLLLALWLDRRRRRALDLSDRARARRRVTSLLLAPVLALSVAVLVDFNRPGNPARAAYGPEIDCCSFDQVENYLRNGFVAGFLTNIPTVLMRHPAGYGPEAIDDVVDRYTADMPDHSGAPSLADVNVVLVLGESIADPTRLEGLELERDPLAQLRTRNLEGWSGSTTASYYGAGTSTMEFQVLTGQSIGLVEPQIFSPYQSAIASEPSFPSIVDWLADSGVETVAIHPYDGRMYQRRDVYDTLGFDEFIEMRDFAEGLKIERSPNISDAAAYDRTIEVLESSDDAVLVNLVTMQNHLPFRQWYDDPPEVDGAVGTEDEASELATWARGLEYSDAALDTFLTQVGELERPTVVVFYGDHYPPVLSDELRAINGDVEPLLTPVLLWSTLPVSDPGRDLGIVDTTTLVPLAAEMVGAPLPPYYRLVLAVQDVVGSVGRGLIVEGDGSVLAEDDLTAEQRQVLEDYRLVQYDFSVGRGYGVDRLWYDWVP